MGVDELGVDENGSRPNGKTLPRFYLAAVENIDYSPQLRDKIWEWPGNEASMFIVLTSSYMQTTVNVFCFS